MMTLCSDVLKALKGKTFATAESCTGGGIGSAFTAVPGSSSVFRGGIVSYCNEIKQKLLGVDEWILQEHGAVSAPVAEAMAVGARKVMEADIAVSVTGLAGPGGDECGNPVGTVYVGYSDSSMTVSREYHFAGNRDSVRRQAIYAALQLILENNP